MPADHPVAAHPLLDRHQGPSPEPAAREGLSSTGIEGRGQRTAIPLEWFLAPTWAVRSTPAGTPGGSWLVLGDADLGAEVERALGGDSSVTILDPSVLETRRPSSECARGVDACALRTGAAVRPVRMPSRVSPVQLGPKAGRGNCRGCDSHRRLFIADTQRAACQRRRPRQSRTCGLWGLGRTLALEHPEIWGGIIDLDESVPAAVAAATPAR